MSIQESEAFPLDFSQLNYGSVISNDVITSIYNVQYSHRDFPMKQMVLGELIEKELSLRGINCLVRVRGGVLVILKPSEAVDYTEKSFKAGIKKAFAYHAHAMRIDQSLLSESEKKQLEHNMRFQAHLIGGIEAGKKMSFIEFEKEKKQLTS